MVGRASIRSVAHHAVEGNAEHHSVGKRNIAQPGTASERGYARVTRPNARVGWTDSCVGHRRFPLVFLDNELPMCNR